MKTADAFVGAVILDSLSFSQAGTAAQAQAMRASGAHAFAGYLGAMNAARLGYLLAAGMGFLPVTFGGEYEDGPLDEIAQLKSLGIPPGVSVFLDMEGLKAFKTDPAKLIAMIDAWATSIAAGGWVPKLYVGVPQPLTGDELWHLKVKGYWKGQGSVRDRFNALAEPTGCGWQMTQMYDSVPRGGVMVDANMIGRDFRLRLPAWAVA